MPGPRVEERLARSRRGVGRSRGRSAKAGDNWRSRRRHGRNVALSALLAIVKLSAIIALPFVVYVRASVFFYDHGAHVWVAIVGEACCGGSPCRSQQRGAFRRCSSLLA